VRAKAAPAAIVVVSKEGSGCGAHGLPYFIMDVGLAVENMLLQAVRLGLMVHPTAGWNEETLGESLGVPDDRRVVTVIFVGRPADTDTLDDEIGAREYAA